MKKTKVILSVLFILLFSRFTLANVINVPAEQPTIQEGINVAVDSDTVLVQPGTYVENINYYGKNITIASLFLTTQDSMYISQTIIDGSQTDIVVRFENEEDSTAVLNGFTVTNGSGIYAGGVLCYGNSNPTIKNSNISQNVAEYGGGITINNSNPYLENVKILNNTAVLNGGGIRCINYNYGITLRNVTISGNYANYGGGIYCNDVYILYVPNITISNNTAYNCGGGIFCLNAFIGINNGVMFENLAEFGGGISFDGSSSILLNTTISDNYAVYEGGGIFYNDGTFSLMLNSILWNNNPQEIYFSENNNQNYITVAYSDIMNGENGIVTNNNGIVDWLDGNIDSDPFFINSNISDFRLLDSSLCIGAAINEIEIDGLLYYAPETDIEGNPRPNPQDSNPDMGAYENPLGEPTGINEDFIIDLKEINLTNHPNPFNPTTTINFSIEKNSNVEIAFFNIKGQKIKSLVNRTLESGNHSIIWNGKNESGINLSSGIYYYKLIVNGKTESVKKCLLLK